MNDPSHTSRSAQQRQAAETMFSVRFHGRAGQGMVTAAELLATAAFNESRHAQAFPRLGAEQMSAPITSFCRFGDKPIRPHGPVAEPDSLLVQDPTLLPGGFTSEAPVDAAPAGKRVLVAGAGPSGPSAAYHLTRLGHQVTRHRDDPRTYPDGDSP
jgi:hypothetical protein